MRRVASVAALVTAVAFLPAASTGCSLIDLSGLTGGSAIATDAGEADGAPSVDASVDASDAGAGDALADVGPDADAGESYRNLVLATPGLRAYWHLDETAGSSVSPAFGLVSGTLFGAVPGSTPLVPNESSGKSLAFSGISDMVQLGDNFDFAGKQPFSVELWHQPKAISGNYVNLWRKQSQTSGGWVVSYENVRGYQFYRLDATTGEQVVSNMIPAAGSIHHVVATYDGSAHRIFIDGVATGNTVNNSVLLLPDTSEPCTLGFEVIGRVDEPALYDVALPAATIAEHYRVGVIPR